MKNSPGYLSLFLLFSFAAAAQTDDIRFQRIGTGDGLSRYRVFSIYQDTFGFIWFENSYKYNGREIKSYPYGAYQAPFIGDLLSESWGNEPDSLIYFDPVRDQFINNLPYWHEDIPIDFGPGVIKDHSGNLWMSSGPANVGLYVYQRSTRSFENIRHRDGDTTSLSSDQVVRIRKDRYGQIWVGTDEGLNLWEKDSTFRQFRHDPDNEYSLSADNIGSIAEDEEGYLWIGTINGLNRLDPVTKEITRISFPTSLYPDVAGIFIDSSGRLWMLTGSGVITYDPDSGVFHQYFVDENGQPIFPAFYFGQINSLALTEDERKRIWMGTFASGIFIFDPATKRVTNYRHDPSDPESLSDDNVRTFMKDRDGRIWIGTFNGVSMYDPNNKGFVHMESDKEGKLFFNTNPKFGALEDRNGYIWVPDYGNGGGLIRFDPRKEEFKFFKNFTGFIFSFLEDKNGNFWVASTAGDLHIFDPTSGRFNFKSKISGSLFRDSNSHIWLGSGRGLFFFSDAKTEPVKIEWDALRGSSGDFKYGPSYMVEGCSGEFWIGTQQQGLLKYDRKNQSVRQYLPEPENPHSLAGSIITGVFMDRDCNLWVAVGGRGLSMLAHDQQNEVDPVFQLWNTENSNLPDNRVSNVIEDHQGRIWVASSTAISQFDRASNTFKIYDPESGMKTVPINRIFPSRDGRFYITGKSGIGYFHPDSLIVNRHIPPVYLQGIRVNGHKLPIKGSRGDTLSFPSPLEQSVALAPSIRLEHWQNEITLEFVALNYTTPIRNKFQYHLDGYDQEWKETDARQPFATYTNLDPGTYTFRVKGSNNDDLWNEEGATLNIIIMPPWWLTWWAKFLYGLAFFAGLYLIRLQELKKQQRKLAAEQEKLAQEQLLTARLRQIDQLKDQFLANTSHELRTPLHGIVGIAESLLGQVEEKTPGEMRENLGMIMASGRRLTSLVNDLLDFSRARHHDLQLNLKHIDLHVLTGVVLQSCRPLLGAAPVELRNEIPEDLPPVLADSNRLQQILYNLVGNAVKFTSQGYVAVQARPLNGMVEVAVEDTGIGIAAEKQEAIFRSFEQADGDTAREYGGTGLGLSITKQLVELHGGAIRVESSPREGARFYFTLPVSDSSIEASAPVDISGARGPEARPAIAPVPELEASLSLPLAGSAGDRIRVLVVDDEPINHQVLRNYLGDNRYLITSVMNGREALEALDLGVRFDLVLLDVMMPRMSGYEVCEKIRETYLPSELPIIMVTAKNQVQDLVEGLGVGANDYLAKPFSRDEFLARVQTQLDLHRIFNVTGKFVPNEFIHVLGRQRITDVQLGDQAELEVTVLFNDIRGYTSLSETMLPEDIFRLVNAYNRRMGPVINANRGFVNQYQGDAIMAIFPQHPVDALQASVGMQRALNAYNRERVAKKRQVLQAGIGLHTGKLIMGIIGDDRRMDATTIADTVNTASRIENLTKHFGASIILSGESRERIGEQEDFNFRPLGKVRMRGKLAAIELFECIDGDEEQLRAHKLNTMGVFQTAMDHYHAKAFPEAMLEFNRITKAHAGDLVARYFFKKASRYAHEGVAEDWMGIEVIEDK